MKYADLVSFEPLESVKVLREAAAPDRAREDVRTFVISDRMADQLANVIVPNLQFERPVDQKGLLAVATYGTGKTHLMSMIAAVAEHAEVAVDVTHPAVRESTAPIAGKFHVIRSEIGATRMSLRDIVCKELEQGLESLGVEFRFPSLDDVSNTKDALSQMMAQFELAHPDRGLLLVLDELLDYLRGRRDAELIQDLSFLREIGEICRSTRFRFLAGVQEAIFDNPRFHGVADAVRRVRDRFEQVRISREDVAFVVQERLLRKTTTQRDAIREHLQGFTPLYEGMAERLEEFVSLFPVHPAYLSVFEQITIVEKRTVLKTLSQEIATLLDHDVPVEDTGLVCHDSYRARLAGDPSFRTIPEVKDVLDRSERLRFTVERGMADKQYVPTALRIIDGLAVHRLTTEDIRVPIGMTYEALRDDLCLLPPGLPKRDALFLQTTVTAIVKKIMTAVSGQFLTENPDNGQVYLDVDKDVDYDQKIEERAASLDDDRLDDAYFKALETVMERRDEPYVAGYRIWEYELPWAERNVTRRGYLFMGAPNERSTAQPPRDFYVYFLQPYAPPRFEDEERADEAFFRLERPDGDFTAALRRYAGATALAAESTASHRPIYQDKADNALRAMVTWLRANMGKAVAVTYRGEGKPLDAWLGGSEGPRSSVKEQIDTIASRALTTYFDARYPDYPTFDAQVTRNNHAECVRQAISHVAGRPTTLGARMLRSLDLLGPEDRVRADGRFASELLQRLDAGGGKVVNRADLLSERDPGVWTWGPWHLETAWLVVVGAALAQVGRLSIRIDGREIDALSLDALTRMDISELEAFTDVAPPRALPLVELRQVAELLGLPPGIIPDSGLEDAALREILSRVSSALERVSLARDVLADTPQFWGTQLIDSSDHRDKRVEELQKVLEDLGARNTVGKMGKLDLGQKRLDAAREGLAELEYIESVLAAREKLSGVAEYLREAADVFGPEADESRDAARLRQDVLDLLHVDDPPDGHAVAELRRRGDEIRRAFAAAAARSYAHDHLDAEGDARKKALLDDERLSTLERLSAIPLLPGDRFAALREELVGIPSLLSFDERRLERSVLPDRGDYRPCAVSGLSASARLEDVERRVPRLLDEWTAALRDSLLAPEMANQIALLGPASAEVEAFRDGGELPAPLSKTFVASLHQVLDRFEVRNVTRDEVWNALFPEGAPTTVEDLRERFAEFLDMQVGSAEAERVRVVPKEQDG